MPFCQPRKTHPSKIWWEVLKKSDYFVLQRNRSQGTSMSNVISGVRSLWQTHVHSYRIIVNKSPFQVLAVAHSQSEIVEDWLFLENTLAPFLRDMDRTSAFSYILYFFNYLVSSEGDAKHALIVRDLVDPSAVTPPSPRKIVPLAQTKGGPASVSWAKSLKDLSEALPDNESDVEKISRSFWANNCLGYDEYIVDGFFAVFTKNELRWFSKLDQFKDLPPKENIEIVLLDRLSDQLLAGLARRGKAALTVQKTLGASVGGSPTSGADGVVQRVADVRRANVQRLAEFVSQLLGGPASRPWLANACLDDIKRIKTEFGSNVIPLGNVTIGAMRHRALLFKALCDWFGIPCRLVVSDFPESLRKKEEEELDCPGLLSKPLWNAVQFESTDESDCTEMYVNLTTFPGEVQCVTAGHHHEPANDGQSGVPVTPPKTEMSKSATTTTAISETDRKTLLSETQRSESFGSSSTLGRPRFEITFSEMVLGPKIGAGSFGEVCKGQWKKTEVAVKRLYAQKDIDMSAFMQEAEMLSQLQHPNVVLFLGVCLKPPNMCLVTEFMSQGTLWRILQKKSIALDDRRRVLIALDVARGMHYLHTYDPCIIHRDLKTANLLVGKDWRVKVCDFGLAKAKLGGHIQTPSDAGSPRYMAPEVLRGESYDEMSDVYSFGVCLWEIVTREEPWAGLSAMEVVGAVGFQQRSLVPPSDCNPAFTTLIADCVQHDPKLRPPFSTIIDRLNLVR